MKTKQNECFIPNTRDEMKLGMDEIDTIWTW